MNATGRVLAGRYRLVAPLARGGMAEVWEGLDQVLSRAVAVKVLQAHLADDEVFVERFRREAVAAARLSSPSIVATYDTGIDAGTAYIVMELVQGRTLRQLVNGSGPLDADLAVAIAIQIADALAAAHRADIVHRDIKPANVLICDDESGLRVKVTDFGIAKARAGAGLDLTQAGMVLGTPKYLSPEQIEGHADADARSDLYSLGVVLFEMLAGEVPLRGATDMATALAHLRDDPPRLSSLRPGTPPALVDLVASLLAKDPDARPATAMAVRRALDAIHREDPAAPPRAQDRAAPTTGVLRAPRRPAGPERSAPAGTSATAALPPLASTPFPATGTPPAKPSRRPALPPRPSVPSPARATPKPRRSPLGRMGRRPRRRRPARTAGMLVGAVGLAGVIVVGLLLSSHRGGEHGDGAVVGIESVHVYLDVTGHTLDHPGETRYTYDGNPATAWYTDKYKKSRDFGGLYDGEGLAIELAGTHRLRSLVVTSPLAGWNAQAYVSTYDVPTGSALGDWGAPTGKAVDAGTTVTLNLGDRTGSWVLLWLTRLGPQKQAGVSQLTVRAAS